MERQLLFSQIRVVLFENEQFLSISSFFNESRKFQAVYLYWVSIDEGDIGVDTDLT